MQDCEQGRQHGTIGQAMKRAVAVAEAAWKSMHSWNGTGRPLRHGWSPPLAQVHTCIAHASIWSLSSVRITLLYLCRAGESNVHMLVSAPTLSNRPLLAAVCIA